MTDQKTILIIDDEIFIRDSLTYFFEDDDYIVFTAENGDRGLDIFFNEPIDLVITDLKMPGKNGFDVMKTILYAKPDTPLIVVSGTGRKEDVIKALRMGAKDYITKPIEDLDMIRHTVQKVFENKRLVQENRQYRQQLEKSEHQYRTITENIAEGVFTVDENQNFTYTNPAFCDMIGFSSEDILAKNIKRFTTEDSYKIVQQQILNRKKGLTNRYEIQIHHKNKQPVHVELACSPFFSDTNAFKGSIVVVRDITKRIEFRKKIQHFLAQKDTISKDVLPICANCKSIRMEKGKWVPVEDYFSTIVFSHGICPACCDKLYPDFDFSDLD
ncbi:response regulator [Desulfobacula sp.]|uniref:response regulator n=1 Tax=Desulfobacula sp. TaxID=2593537 RepID=UPI00261FEA32|nr:response regulator [Desulfobacula sp.]